MPFFSKEASDLTVPKRTIQWHYLQLCESISKPPNPRKRANQLLPSISGDFPLLPCSFHISGLIARNSVASYSRRLVVKS